MFVSNSVQNIPLGQELTSQQAWNIQVKEKRESKKNGSYKFDRPDEFALFQKGIRTREGEMNPNYPVNYTLIELNKAKQSVQYEQQLNARSAAGTITWTERGPANVPGRTRAMVVMPQDATHNTWVIGSVGGGIWKTTDGGSLWVEKTKDLPNIAFTTIALAESNPNILYAGTGEGGLGGVDGIGGNGVFKSVDAGETWSQLASTTSSENFQNVNRLIIDPNDENILLICNSYGVGFQTGIFKSVDGGASWNSSILKDNSGTRGFQQIVATPGNFNIQYATFDEVGVYKSVDAGDSWSLSNSGMSPTGRVEMAVSPVNSSKIFASAEGGGKSLLYVSTDAAVSWDLVDVSFSGEAADFLGGQGWYDNTILCSPYDENVVYVGGVSILKVVLGSGSSSTTTAFDGAEENGTSTFFGLNPFNSGTVYDKKIVVGADADGTSIEIRFGSGISQKAHRFMVPTGQGSGVPENNYSYQDYVDVPFEVWDVDNNRQLMVSFRDQQENGTFELIGFNVGGDASTHSREYLYINNVDYNASTPNSSIAVNGGHTFKEMYFFWPFLPVNGTWDPANFPTSNFRINTHTISVLDSETDVVADPYGAFDGTNSFSQFGVDVHPDQHGFIAIKEDDANKMFRILLSNDGGPFISKSSADPGVTEGDWTMVGNTYNTGQFYGADKKPGEDAYFGGMQDNGTWQSNNGADATTNYDFRIGGDGFEVLWHSQNPDKLIGGSQFNNFSRSINGGVSFANATNGLSGDHPFISKLAGSKKSPDVIYTVSSAGVFKSTNFGSNWQLTSISNLWGGVSSFLDVEVSRANPNIVWAGSGISDVSDRRIHVSTNQGQTFSATSFTDLASGTITKLASHPTDPSTAYIMFSQAKRPKIVRTEDLGVTWTDISGFGTNSVSSNGFPDVAVYCLYVHFDNPDIMWAGTDIGIVESLDNGVSWHLLNNDMPKVAVWDMKGQDNQIVIATHGRGIWTATVDNSQTNFKDGPTITSFGTSPQKELVFRVEALEVYDSTEVFVNSVLMKTFYAVNVGESQFDIPNVIVGNREVNLVSYIDGTPIYSNPKTLNQLNLFDPVDGFMEFMKTSNNFYLDGLEIVNNTGNPALESLHNYPLDTILKATLLQPIIVSGSNSSFNYEDIALIEPGDAGASFGDDAFNDYVVVEATKDGLNWIPLEDGYDASANANWLAAYNDRNLINSSLFVEHMLDLTNKFNVGDTLLFRFRLFSNSQNVGWGWSIDNIYIQTEPLGVGKNSEIIDYSVYPVPSKGAFRLDYQLVSSSDVRLEISTVTGKKIKTYNLGTKSPGNYRFKLENYRLENGVYIFSLRTKSGISSQRVLISK